MAAPEPVFSATGPWMIACDICRRYLDIFGGATSHVDALKASEPVLAAFPNRYEASVGAMRSGWGVDLPDGDDAYEYESAAAWRDCEAVCKGCRR